MRSLAFAVLFAVHSPASADCESSRVRIMAAGDSITRGVAGSSTGGGWREELSSLLGLSGVLVDFVGSQADGPQSDNEHEGIDATACDHFVTNLSNRVATYRPDYVLLSCGINDIRDAGGQDQEAVDALSDLGDAIAAAAPVPVFVADLVRYDGGVSVVEARHAAFNAGLEALVAQYPHATLVNRFGNLLGPEDMADILHPNDSGYRKMGAEWADELASANLVKRR